MSDEPRFPAADEAKERRSAYRTTGAAPAPEPTPRRLVVSRPEEQSAPAPAQLSKEEVRALLEVGGARGGRDAFLRRGGIIVVPTGLVMFAARTLLGAAAPYVMFVAGVVALAWMARPLFKKTDW